MAAAFISISQNGSFRRYISNYYLFVFRSFCTRSWACSKVALTFDISTNICRALSNDSWVARSLGDTNVPNIDNDLLRSIWAWLTTETGDPPPSELVSFGSEFWDVRRFRCRGLLDLFCSNSSSSNLAFSGYLSESSEDDHLHKVKLGKPKSGLSSHWCTSKVVEAWWDLRSNKVLLMRDAPIECRALANSNQPSRRAEDKESMRIR